MTTTRINVHSSINCILQQEKLYEAQREVMGVVQSVKEAENHLAELEQHQRRLTQQRTEVHVYI